MAKPYPFRLRLASLLVLHRRKGVVGVSVYTLKGVVTARQAWYDHA